MIITITIINITTKKLYILGKNTLYSVMDVLLRHGHVLYVMVICDARFMFASEFCFLFFIFYAKACFYPVVMNTKKIKVDLYLCFSF